VIPDVEQFTLAPPVPRKEKNYTHTPPAPALALVSGIRTRIEEKQNNRAHLRQSKG
jgi:hypothetical protein